MATTSPDNIWTPDSTDDYSLTVDLAAMADTVQQAIVNQASRFSSVVADSAARSALFPSPVQGNRVFRNDVGYEETYRGAYNAATNPSGASSAGWYPTHRRFFANRTGTQTLSANWNVISTALSATRNDGLGTFSPTGAFTVTAGGQYEVRASVFLRDAISPYAIQILRNSTTPDSSAVIAAGIVEGSGASRGGFPIQNTLALNAGDILRVMVYAGPSSGNTVSTSLGVSSASFSIEKIL